MGLDIVELFIRVEDEFGITIPDLEAQEATTVGELYEVVLAKVSCESRDICLKDWSRDDVWKLFVD